MTKIFVFGSNLAGRHGKGAALFAMRNYGAEYGVGSGRTGNAYAIPTKDERLRTLHISEIESHVEAFCEYAHNNLRYTFEVTPFGCGLAGHDMRAIAALLRKHRMPANCYLTPSWLDHIAPNLEEGE